MGGFQQNGRSAVERFDCQPVQKPLPGHRAVGLDEEAVLRPRVPQCLPRPLVRHGTGEKVAAHRGQVRRLVDFACLVHLPAVHSQQPRQVARVADVHRVGQ